MNPCVACFQPMQPRIDHGSVWVGDDRRQLLQKLEAACGPQVADASALTCYQCGENLLWRDLQSLLPQSQRLRVRLTLGFCSTQACTLLGVWQYLQSS